MNIEKIQRGLAAPPSDEFEEWCTEWINLNEDLIALLRLPSTVGRLDQIRSVAKDAWDAGQKVQAAKAKAESVDDRPRRRGEIDEAALLAKRHNLFITSIRDVNSYVIEARRSGKKPICVQTASWREMIDNLEAMARRGVL